jgi:membrane-associated phospholipid phosphatase
VWSAQASRDRSLAADRLARLGENLGGPYAAAPALLATAGLARLTGHAALAAASERVALAGAVALGTTFALKEAIGRTRPDEPPHASDRFDAFSGHDALPSAHTTLAFAMAGAISNESRSRWAPAVLYPAATLVAWARVHQRRHWPSDVVAGAVIGEELGRVTDRFARRRLPDGLVVLVWPAARGAHAEVRARF